MHSFKVRYRQLGGHVHVRLFSSAAGPEYTHACNGSLTFDEKEWPFFLNVLVRGYGFSDQSTVSVQMIPETLDEVDA